MHELYLSIDETAGTVAAFLEIWNGDILEHVVCLGSRGRKQVSPVVAFKTLANFKRKKLTPDAYSCLLKSLNNPEKLEKFIGSGSLDQIHLELYDVYMRFETHTSSWRSEVDLKRNKWEGWLKLKRILQEKNEPKTNFSLIRGLLDNEYPYFFLHNELKDTFLYLGLYSTDGLRVRFSSESMLENLFYKYAGSVQLTVSELEELKSSSRGTLKESLFFLPFIAEEYMDTYSGYSLPCFQAVKRVIDPREGYKAIDNSSIAAFIGEDRRTPTLNATLIESGHLIKDKLKYFFLEMLDYKVALAFYTNKGYVVEIPATKDQFKDIGLYHLTKKTDLTLFQLKRIIDADTHKDLSEVLIPRSREQCIPGCVMRVGKINKSGEWFSIQRPELASLFKEYKENLYNGLSKKSALNYVEEPKEETVWPDEEAVNLMKEAVEETKPKTKLRLRLEEEYWDFLRGVRYKSPENKEVISNKMKAEEALRFTQGSHYIRPEVTVIKDGNERGILSMFDKMFKKVPAVVDLLTGQAAIKNSDQSLAVLCSEVIDGKEVFSIEETPFENLTITLPGIALRRPLNQIEKGDIHVFGNNEMGFVTEVGENNLKVLHPDGKVSTVSPVKNRLVGQSGFMVVSNFTNMQKGGDNSHLMLMLAMSQGKEMDDQTRMMLMLSMSRGKELDPQMLMLMSMSGGNGNMEMLLPLMMMRG